MAGLSHSVPTRTRGIGVEHAGFSFRCNVTDPPDRIRDGGGNLVTSVVRTSAGKYTVTLNHPRPRQLIAVIADIHQAAAAVTKVFVKVNVDSYSASAGTFVIETVLDDGTPAVDDNADNDVIHVIMLMQVTNTLVQA